LLGVLAGLFVVTLYLPSAVHYVPKAWVGRHLPGFSMGLLFIAAVFLFRFLPVSSTRSGPGPGASRLLLLLILIVAAWLRLGRFTDPIGPYWNDNMLNISPARNIIDFREHNLMFAMSHAPFASYWLVLWWSLLDGLSGFEIQRLGPVLTDLISLWIIYLAGKELGGRSAGLWSALFLAVSKPMVLSCVSGQGAQYMFPGMALYLLFTVRYLRRPDARHAIAWGAATVFGLYTYNAYRPLLPFVVSWTFLVLVLREWRRRASLEAWLLAAGLWAWFLYEFLQKHDMLAPVPFIRSHPGVVMAAAVLLVLKSGLEAGARPASGAVARWAAGVLVLMLIACPLALHSQFAGHVTGASVFKEADAADLAARWGVVVDNTRIALRCLFLGGPDRPDMNLPQSAFFEYPAIALILLGLSWLLSGEPVIRWMLLGTAVVGLSPHVLSVNPYSSKLAVLPPVLLLSAGVAVARVHAALGSFVALGLSRFLIGSLLLVTAWLGIVNHRIVYGIWYEQTSSDTPVFRAVRDHGKGRKVYLAQYHPGYFSSAQAVLLDGSDARMLNAVNEVETASGGRPADVLVAVFGLDRANHDALSAAYPDARKIPIPSPNAPPGVPPFQTLFLVSGDEIAARPGGPFRPAPKNPWVRRVYGGHYGLGRGIAMRLDHVERPDGALPPDCDTATVRIDGKVRLEKGGTYEFRSRGLNYAVLDIGNRRALEMRPQRGRMGEESRRVRLKAGVHPAILRSFLQRGTEIPVVEWRLAGESDWRPLPDLAAAPE
jgi:hypothetical protein